MLFFVVFLLLFTSFQNDIHPSCPWHPISCSPQICYSYELGPLGASLHAPFTKVITSLCMSSEFFSSILSVFLAAFRRNFGCQHVLTKFVHDFKVVIGKGLNVGVVLMDLSKAFVCVPHGLLLTKLKYYGLTDQACLLLKSCISWAWGPVYHGVPSPRVHSRTIDFKYFHS